MLFLPLSNGYIVKLLFTLILTATGGDFTTTKEKEKQITSLKLPPCQACKMVVESFLKVSSRNYSVVENSLPTAIKNMPCLYKLLVIV